jgi:predicted RNase H-like HicB family nuclease
MNFPVVIHKEPDSVYGVSVPDLPGCISAGSTIDEALSQVREAIGVHLDGILQDGLDWPTPSDIETLRQDQDYADGIWAIVSVDVDPSQQAA